MVIIFLILVLSTQKERRPCFKVICHLGKVLDNFAVFLFGSHGAVPVRLHFKNELNIQQQHLQDPPQFLSRDCALSAQPPARDWL